MRSTTHSIKMWLGLGLCLLGSACDEDPLGQIVLAVQTDMHLPKDVDTVRIEVFNEGVPKFKNDYERLGTVEAPFLLPGTITLVGSEEPSDAVQIVVSARSGGREGSLRMVREVVTTIPEERTVTLSVPLQFLCEGQVAEVDGNVASDCGEGQTCLAGSCGDKAIDSASLPDYVAEDVVTEGICLDVAVCFNQGAPADLDAGDCSVAPRNSPANYALQTEGDGICGAFGCFVALDAESTLGWQTRDDGRVQLPPAVCQQMASGKLVNVIEAPANAVCPTKLVSVPTCGSWSAAAPAAPVVGPITLAGGQVQPVSLALGAGEVVWASAGTFTDDGTVKSVDFLGGTPLLIAGDQVPPRDVTTSGQGSGTIFLWTQSDADDPTGGAIMQRNSSGTVGPLIGNLELPEGIAVFGDSLYWTQFAQTGGIFRAPVDGGPAVLLAQGNYPVRIVADERYVYWTNEGTSVLDPPDGSVARLDTQTSQVETVASDVSTPRALALGFEGGSLRASALYYAVFGEAGSLVRVSLAGEALGAPEPLVDNLPYPNGIAVHADGFVYWSNRGDGTIMRIATDAAPGSDAELIAEGQRSPSTVAVDESSVYWLNEGNAGEANGGVLRIAKPQ